jgi:hypothetical protein
MTNADNARSFSVDIQRLVAGLAADAVVKATQKLALDALRSLILKSPVGFPPNWKNPAPKGYVGGQFRGAWQLSVGSPGTGITGKSRPGQTGSKTAAAAAASEAVGELSKIRAYDPVYIVNGLPYAERLENGWSQQAPLGMVALTVSELQSVILNYENGEVK